MRGITKQEFYRLRSKFRLLKRIYDNRGIPYGPQFLINKLSKNPIDGQIIQLLLNNKCAFTTRVTERLTELKKMNCEINKTLIAALGSSGKREEFYYQYGPVTP